MRAGEYDQYQQEILDPASPLTEFRPEVVVLATNWRSLGLPDETGQPAETVRAIMDQIDRFSAGVSTAIRSGCYPDEFRGAGSRLFGRLSAAAAGGRTRILQRLNLELWDAAQNNRRVDSRRRAACRDHWKPPHWSDPAMWIAAKQYPSPDAAPMLTRNLAALVRALCGLTSKCAVLDLDGTLWGGIIGEDGLNGIRLGGDAEGEAYRISQISAWAEHGAEFRCALSSKNNEEDAR